MTLEYSVDKIDLTDVDLFLHGDPHAVRRMEPHIRELVTKILDDVCEKGECDFVMDISRLVPLEVICEMVRVPEGDWESMFELSNRVLGFDDPEYGGGRDFQDLTPEE